MASFSASKGSRFAFTRISERLRQWGARFLIVGTVCLCALTMPLAQGAEPANRKVRIVFRYDDYCQSSATWVEERILTLFESLRARHVFAVIPKKGGLMGGDKAAMLKKYYDSGTLEIALHGYEHVKYWGDSEYCNRPYATQLSMLAEGKELLETATGAKVVTFVPPWNTCDRTTLKALQAAGIDILSAHCSGPVDQHLAYAPTQCGMKGVRLALEQARRCMADAGPLIIVGYHDFEFQELHDPRGSEVTVDDFERLVRGLAVEPDVELVSLSDLLSSQCDLSGRRQRANATYNLRDRSVPPLGINRVSVYLTCEYLENNGLLTLPRRLIWGWYLVIAVMAATAGSLVIRFCGPSRALRRLATTLLVLVLLGGALYGFYDYRMFSFWEGLSGLVATSGALVGALLESAWAGTSRRRGAA